MGTQEVPLPFQFELLLGKDRDRWPPEAIEAAHHGDVCDIMTPPTPLPELWSGAIPNNALGLQRSWTRTGKGSPVTVASTTYMGMNALHATGGFGKLLAYQYLVEEVGMEVDKPDIA